MTRDSRISQESQSSEDIDTRSDGQAAAEKVYPKFRRRQYVINPNFQWKMVTWGSLLTAVLVLCVYFYDLYLFRSLEGSVLASGIVTSGQWKEVMNNFEMSRAVSFSVFVVVVFLVVIWFYVLMSHRIAGPIFRTVKFLTENEHKLQGAANSQVASDHNEGADKNATVAKKEDGSVVEPPYGFQLRFRKKDFFPELADAVNKKLRTGESSDK